MKKNLRLDNNKIKNKLHPKVLKRLEELGFTKLYPPQFKALIPALNGRNLIVAIPTASGKTLIAEITAITTFLQSHSENNPEKILYLTPLKALAYEKYNDFQKHWKKLGLNVGIAVGDPDEIDTSIFSKDCIILTNEKADAIFRLQPGFSNAVSLVIIDEIHLLNDPSRGPTLEILLSRLREINPNIQIIGLSATIANADHLAKWLNAELIKSNWRPIKLQEGIIKANKCFYPNEKISNIGNEEIYEKNNDITYEKTFEEFTENGVIRTLPSFSAENPIINAILETINEGGQCLVFTNSRKDTSSLAQRIAPFLFKHLNLDEIRKLKNISNEFKENYSDGTTSSDELIYTLKNGIAFHHAGLSQKILNFIIKHFREGKIKVICCTPTLAAGVNTPARRVIIKTIFRYEGQKGMVPIPVLEYKQMAGRAGRPGYDPYGDVLTIAQNENVALLLLSKYINGEIEPILSQLVESGGFVKHLLGLIVSKIGNNSETLFEFFKKTLYYWQLQNGIFDINYIIESNSTPDIKAQASTNNKKNKSIKRKNQNSLSNSISSKYFKTRPRTKKEGRGADPLGLFGDEQAIFSTKIKNSIKKKEKKIEELPYPTFGLGFATAEDVYIAKQKGKEREKRERNEKEKRENNEKEKRENNEKEKEEKMEIAKYFKKRIDNLLQFLADCSLIQYTDLTQRYFKPTTFGRITTQYYFPPDSAVKLREFFKAIKYLKYSTDYLIKPLSLLYGIIALSDLQLFYLYKEEQAKVRIFYEDRKEMFEPLEQIIYNIIEKYELPELLEANRNNNKLNNENNLKNKKASFERYKIIKNLMILWGWMNEMSEIDIVESFHIGTGDLHRLVENSRWIFRFIVQLVKMDSDKIKENIEIEDEFFILIKTIEKRIRYGVKPDIIELLKIPNVGRVRARNLFRGGYTNIESIAESTENNLQRIPLIGDNLAKKIYEFARKYTEKVKGKEKNKNNNKYKKANLKTAKKREKNKKSGDMDKDIMKMYEKNKVSKLTKSKKKKNKRKTIPSSQRRLF